MSRIVHFRSLRLIVVTVLAVSSPVFFLFWRTGADFEEPRWGTWADWCVAGVTLGLLGFEIYRADNAERRLRASNARRVHAWVRPSNWEIEGQGVVQTIAGGWELVVANDGDDVVVEWLAVVVDSTGNRLVAASSGTHGPLSPRSRRVFEVTPSDAEDNPPGQIIPKTYPLEATTTIRFVDFDNETWERIGGGGPVPVPYEAERLRVPRGAPIAHSMVRALIRQGMTVRHLSDG